MTGTPLGVASIQIALRVDTFRPIVIAHTAPPHIHIERHVTIAPPIAEQTLQGISKCLSKVTIEVSVNKWIQGGIEIANPEENGHHNFGYITCITECGNCVPAMTKKGKR